jgi:uncharacterized peroxidase-related enzyme
VQWVTTDVRLRILDSGHDLPTRLTLGLMRRIGRTEVPAVIKLASYRHLYFGTPYHAVVQDVMRGPSAWTVGERELIAAFTSSRNQCQFCTSAHQAFAGSVEGDDVVAAALDAPATAPLRRELIAVLEFLAKLADEPDNVTAEDVAAVCAAGVSDAALDEAVHVSVLFHVINRVVDAAGAGPLEGRGLEIARRVVMKGGYKLPAPIRFASRAR